MSQRLPQNLGQAEHQYLDLVKLIMDEGDPRMDRTGVGTRAIHGHMMRFDLRDGTIPLLTTKRIPWNAVRTELLWFLSGSSNIRPLLERKVTIWSDWPYANYKKATDDTLSMKEFEQKIVEDEAFAQQWGDLGPVYGVQWRRWEGPDGKTYDQIQDAIDRLRRDPMSRRIIFHGWNVPFLDQMALPPCHLLYQFFCNSKGELSLSLYQRSCDVGLGVPFNIASAALLVHLMAREVGLKPGGLVWYGHDVHLYENHIEPLREQLVRTPKAFPTLSFAREASLFETLPEDLVLEGYEPAPTIKMDVAV